MTFKAGDRVKCVDAGGNRGINRGRVYVVYREHGGLVYLDGLNYGGYYPWRFELAESTVDVLKHGMSPADLADAVEQTITACRERVTGTGADQYHKGTSQQFEGLTVSELVGMAREEAQDLVVYAVMTDIRLARIEAAIKGAGL